MEYKKVDWRSVPPPLVPIYFMEIDALRDLLENDSKAIGPNGVAAMMSYFEEYEQYEKMALLQEYHTSNEIFDDFTLPPGEWEEVEGGYIRPLSDEEVDNLIKGGFNIPPPPREDDETDFYSKQNPF